IKYGCERQLHLCPSQEALRVQVEDNGATPSINQDELVVNDLKYTQRSIGLRRIVDGRLIGSGGLAGGINKGKDALARPPFSIVSILGARKDGDPLIAFLPRTLIPKSKARLGKGHVSVFNHDAPADLALRWAREWVGDIFLRRDVEIKGGSVCRA